MSIDVWSLGELDLAAYLSRIGYDGATAPTADTLIALHRAHVATVPFENLDVILGRGVDTRLAAIQEKVVTHGRGGYCFEVNALFATALERLGFDVQRRLGRVGDPAVKINPRTHLVSVVTIDGTEWLADVGFGSGLLEPLIVQDHVPVRQGDWTCRLVAGAHGSWHLQSLVGDQWETLYLVAPDMTYPSDVVMGNHYTSTLPTSPFVLWPVVVRKDDHRVRTLHGRRLIERRPDGTETVTTLSDDEVPKALAELGVVLDDSDTAALVDFLRQKVEEASVAGSP